MNERFTHYIKDKERKLEYLRFVYIEMITHGFILTCRSYGKDETWIRMMRKLFKLYAGSIGDDGRIIIGKIPEEHRESLARLNDVVGDYLNRKFDKAYTASFWSKEELTDTAYDDSMVLRGIRRID